MTENIISKNFNSETVSKKFNVIRKLKLPIPKVKQFILQTWNGKNILLLLIYKITSTNHFILSLVVTLLYYMLVLMLACVGKILRYAADALMAPYEWKNKWLWIIFVQASGSRTSIFMQTYIWLKRVPTRKYARCTASMLNLIQIRLYVEPILLTSLV